MGLAETAELSVRIGLKDNLSGGLDRMGRSVGRFDAGIGRATKGVGQVGRGLARAGLLVGGAAIAGLSAAAKAAIDFEDAFAGVRKTVDEADLTAVGLSFEKLERSFRDLATEIPISASELARIGEAAGALGVEAGSILKFTDVVAKLGVTTDLSSDQAATALGKIGTILKFTTQDYVDFADSLVNLGNKGASTESEIIAITQRFAASAAQAGLATDEIIALASATASLGVMPEAGGGALSRLFGNLSGDIALANKQGKAFAKLTGIEIPAAQRMLNKGQGLKLFDNLLKSIKDLDRVDAAKALAALGITNTRDRDVILKLAQNYEFLNEQLEISKTSTGALSEEATKRFATVRSSLQLLKNNLIEAALTIGGDASDPNSFIGSIGGAAKKLSEFLKDPANKADLEAFGAKIGGIINGIDFDKLFKSARSAADVLKPALDTVLLIINALGKLPDEVKGAGIGLVGLNALSGGLVGKGAGNIVGGLGEALAKGLATRIPLFGAAFVQRVWVVNQGIGGVGGGAAGAAGGGASAAGAAGGLLAPGAAPLIVGAALPFAMFYGIPAIVKAVYGAGTPGSEAGVVEGRTGSSPTAFTSGLERQLGALTTNVPRLVEETHGTNIGVTKLNNAQLLALGEQRDTTDAVARGAMRTAAETRGAAMLGAKAQAATKERLAGLQERANNKLDLIRAKRTMFTVNNTIPITTTLSIADINARTIARTRIAKHAKVTVW